MATCDIEPSCFQQFKSFRFRKNKSSAAALILKIDVKKLLIVVDQLLEDVTLEQLVEEIPDNTPRYILYSYEYTHQDGRKSNPLVGIFYCPFETSDNLRMLYASAKTLVFQAAEIPSKVLDLNDTQELDQSWIDAGVGLSKSRP